MLIRLRDLQSLSAVSEDGGRHHVSDLMGAQAEPSVTHVVTRLAGWFERHGCAVRADAFGTPDLDAGTWPSALSKDAAEDAGAGGIVAVLCDPDTTPAPAQVAQAEGSGPLANLSDLHGLPVRAADGTRAGTVMDMVIDTDARRVAMLVVETGGGTNQRVVPAEVFDRIDWVGGTVHLKCGADPVSGAPDLHEVGTAIEGHWYNRVLAYYGFG
ncbi:PRC-barrel domain-containing protein [Jannaschia sp. LMIT008]|uniref:PRC-barrel domain-containing protein n=1 Tax=Jannaschia maritima TaxID=3032585 RepID=UPI00281283AC|nr:PRC-barrel domain-containing protein [Jannaschia sp. LMIT008]